MKHDSKTGDSADGAVAHWPRRDFLKGFGLAASAAATTHLAPSANAASATSHAGGTTPTPLKVTLTINGSQETQSIDPRTTLVDLLREKMGLVGTKKGCDHGACGACTVHVNHQRVLACLTLVATIDGAEITTIEGLAKNDQLHPMQEAFLRCDGYQCGYCTPGQIMSAVACIEEGHAHGSAEETREWMSGNLCRCSAYPNIIAAVRQTSGAEPAKDPAEALS